jgi:hypothetical protein
VASIAATLHRLEFNHSSRASRPSVAVAKVRQSRVALIPDIARTHATTLSLVNVQSGDAIMHHVIFASSRLPPARALYQYKS